MEVPILYNYIPYAQKRKGLFRVETREYKLPGPGWVQVLEEMTIIGENDHCYVKHLIEGVGHDRNDEKYGKPYKLGVGSHKTRLEKWLPTQTELFL